MEFEACLVAQCDALIEALNRRKAQLLAQVNKEHEHKLKVSEPHVSARTRRERFQTSSLKICGKQSGSHWFQRRLSLGRLHQDWGQRGPEPA